MLKESNNSLVGVFMFAYLYRCIDISATKTSKEACLTYKY